MTPEERLQKLQRLKELRDAQGQSAQMEAYREQGAPSGFLQGLGDMAAGSGQFVPRVLEQATSLGGIAPNPISDLYRQSYERTGDPYAQQREQEYQGRRQAAGDEGIDWARIGGNVANPLNYVGGAGMLSTAIRGAGIGALQPMQDTENYWSDTAIRGGVGAVGAMAGKAIGDKVSGEVSKRGQQVAQLLKEKVPLTIGQRLGGAANTVEEKLMSVPLLGDMISGARSRSTEQINRAAYARALNPVGEKLPDDVALGRDAVSYIGEKLSDKYDDLLPKLTGRADQQFFGDLSNLRNMVQADDIMNPAEKAVFDRIMKNTVENKFSQAGGVTGESLKVIESELGSRAAKLQAGDVSQRQLADALKEAQAAIRSMVERSNPSYAESLKNINSGYANLLRVERAAGAGESGVFTPRQLSTAVKALDSSKNKRAFARGNALMQDLSDAGVAVASNRVPNSGTTDRALLFGLGAAGLGGYSQTEAPLSDYAGYAAAALAPSLLYTRGGVAASNAIGSGIGAALRNPVGQAGARALPYVAPHLVSPVFRE